jgi:hypothetical protein
VRQRDEDVERLDLSGERRAEGARGDGVARTFAVLDGRAVGEHHGEPIELELLGGEGALVHLDLEDAPVVGDRRAQALRAQPLVVAIELLEVVLRDEQPLRPDELARFHCGTPTLGVEGIVGVDGVDGNDGVVGTEGQRR